MESRPGNRRVHARHALALATIVAAVIAAGRAPGAAPSSSSPHALYAAVGPDMAWYGLDVDHGALAKRGTVTLPANVEEAWVHPSKPLLYVAWSNGNPTYPGGSAYVPKLGTDHGVTIFRIDRASGALAPFGTPLSLRSRPIYLATDGPGKHLLVALNVPSSLSVYRLEADGTIGAEVPPAAPLETGTYGHQVRVGPTSRIAVLVTRGYPPADGTPAIPGSVQVYALANGQLRNNGAIAPGKDFNPRNLEFHPTRPWAFLTLAMQHKLQLYKIGAEGRLDPTPVFTKDTLTEPGNIRPGQVLGNVRIHPNGRYLYVANRASGTAMVDGRRAFVGGENSIAVYDVNQQTGEPVRIQSIDTQGLHPRTFALDDQARILVAANQMAIPVRDATGVHVVPASLTVFRIGEKGTLEFIRKYDIETEGSRQLFWVGIVSLR